MATCLATGCNSEATSQWLRWCTQDELNDYMASGDLPQGTTEATRSIYACDDHKLETDTGEADLGLMSVTHKSVCQAPPECTCDVEVPTRVQE
jgi:hypothetical protein